MSTTKLIRTGGALAATAAIALGTANIATAHGKKDSATGSVSGHSVRVLPTGSRTANGAKKAGSSAGSVSFHGHPVIRESPQR